MLHVILIRPGSTLFDEQGRIKGNLDIPLSLSGADQAERAAVELKARSIDAVYTSPGESAEETARLIAEAHGLKARQLEQLQNLDQGLWQGKLIEEVKSRQPKVYKSWQESPENVCPPEGEMLESAVDRVERALAKMFKKHKSGTIAIVAAEPLASLIQCRLKGERLPDLWLAEHRCGQWDLIEVPEKPVAST